LSSGRVRDKFVSPASTRLNVDDHAAVSEDHAKLLQPGDSSAPCLNFVQLVFVQSGNVTVRVYETGVLAERLVVVKNPPMRDRAVHLHLAR